ncbi:unnamed protein product [Effrenium voratum]|nr:unnamed protein product [Effrenium voratum]
MGHLFGARRPEGMLPPGSKPAQAKAKALQEDADPLRVAIDYIVILAMLVAFAKMSLDVARSAQRSLQPVETHKAQRREALEAAYAPSCRLARRLPQSWVAERDIIEL